MKYNALFIAAVLLFLNVVVPPFQSPDEPHHFAAAVLYARGEAGRDAVESGVIGMMDRANWWRLVGIGRPSPLPGRIAEIRFLMEGSESGDFRTRLDRFVLWHRAAGVAMRPFAGWGLERLYYLCRIAAALFLAAALFFLWKAIGVLAGAFGPVARWAFYLVFFLPQYLLTGASVSPDSFVLALSAVFFYGAVSLIVGKPRAWQAALIVLPAAIGLLTDRSAFILAALAVLVPFFMMTRKNYQNVVVLTIFGAVAAILLVYAAALAFPLEIERMFLNANYVLAGAKSAFSGMFKTDTYTLGYWSFMANSFLFKFGWLVFGAPKLVYWIWRLTLGGIAVGLVVQIVGWAKRRVRGAAAREVVERASGAGAGMAGDVVGRGISGGDGSDGEAAGSGSLPGLGGSATLRWTLFSIVALGIQAVGVWVYYGNNHFFGQGRYFHPLIVPIALFAVLGLSGFGDLIKKGAGKMVVAGAIMAEFLLLAFSAWHDIVPVFHMILRGPHPGI